MPIADLDLPLADIGLIDVSPNRSFDRNGENREIPHTGTEFFALFVRSFSSLSSKVFHSRCKEPVKTRNERKLA